MKTIIISGASGLLGQHLCKYFATKFKVIGLYNSTLPTPIPEVDHIQLNLLDKLNVQKFFNEITPDYMIHTAGLTSVDECEQYPENAYNQNVICTKNLCLSIDQKKTKFILISTDHLFSGAQANYSEDSPVEPLNIYAKTKLEAENEVKKITNSICIRTNFYGGHTFKKLSFSSWIYSELKNEKKINMFDDVFFSPISIISLTVNLNLIMETEISGIFNLVGSERLSKYEFAIKLAQIFELSTSLINRTSVDNFTFKAKRPKDMSLSINKISQSLKGFQKETVEEGLAKIKRHNLI